MIKEYQTPSKKIARLMNRIIIIVLFVIALVALNTNNAASDDFAYKVTARCLGEASFATEGCAWSVVNRLNAGWAKSKVLNAYYAPDVTPTQADIEKVRPILDGSTEQENPDYYYMFSLSDVKYLGKKINQDTLLDTVVSIPNKSEIWFYSIEALK